jgi:hypothetical protein
VRSPVSPGRVNECVLQAHFLDNGGRFAMFELMYMRRDLVKMNKYLPYSSLR